MIEDNSHVVLASTSEVSDNHNEAKCNKKKYRYISDLERLKLILLIVVYRLNCCQAAKKLAIPYTNAKVIVKMYKEEGRIH